MKLNKRKVLIVLSILFFWIGGILLGGIFGWWSREDEVDELRQQFNSQGEALARSQQREQAVDENLKATLTELSKVRQELKIAQEELRVFFWNSSAQIGKADSLEDYFNQASSLAKRGLLYLDQAQPVEKVFQGFFNEFPSIEEIIKFFEENEYGVCRHRASLGYWLLRERYPEKDIWLVLGKFTALGNNSTNILDILDTNHAWVEMDGRIIDFSVEEGGQYRSFVRVRDHSPDGNNTIRIDRAEVLAEYEEDKN